MQLPKKYKENFDIRSEGPSSGVTQTILHSKRRNFPYIFQYPHQRKLVHIIGTTYTGTDSSRLFVAKARH